MKNKLILNKNEIMDTLGNKYKHISNIFSTRFGIVNAMLERHELDKYNLYMYQCLSANTTNLFGLKREVSSGGLGINENKRIAMTSCLAEALERYCMSYIPQNEIIKSKKSKLPKVNTFDSFFTYTQNQYNNYENFLNPNTEEIEWVKIYNIENNKIFKYWPASLIYLPYEINKPVAETTSTGMAADFTIEECIQSGLLELIERDALMINFMKKLNPPEINLDSITGKNKKIINLIKEDYNIKIYKLYSDINIPIYLSIIYKGKNRKKHYGIGACANFDSDYAINKSLKECLFTYFYSLNIMRDKVNNPDNIKALYEHFLYYQGKNFDKLLFNSRMINYTREKTNYNEVIKSLKENNIEVYYKELTTEDIVQTKLKVVKVIAPGLIDLNKTHKYPRLAAKRYNEVPKKLNIECIEGLTKLPHPFP